EPVSKAPATKEPIMIIVLKSGASDAEVEDVCHRITAMGYSPHTIRGALRTVIGAVGDDRGKDALRSLESLECVESVTPILKPYKLASRHPPGRRPQRAELLAAQARRRRREARPPEAGHGHDDPGVAPVRGVRAGARQPERHPLRAGYPDFRGLDAVHARPERCARRQEALAPAHLRRPEPRHGPLGARRGDGHGWRRGRRRWAHHRGPPPT